MAQTLHNLLKTLDKFVKHCNSEYSLNLYKKIIIIKIIKTQCKLTGEECSAGTHVHFDHSQVSIFLLMKVIT